MKKHIQNYSNMVKRFLKSLSKHDAMAAAVGGNYDRVGAKELLLLEMYGLKPDSFVVDIGCGSGRLTKRLRAFRDIRYHGTDIVKDLLNYAKETAGRKDFKFSLVDGLKIPEADGVADIVCFFSVVTHLSHEQSYVYLEEAKRVLKPGGIIICSFLEFTTKLGQEIFTHNIDTIKAGQELPHPNVHINPCDFFSWADRLDMEKVRYKSGDEQFIQVKDGRFLPDLEDGVHTFGQSVIVLKKPI